MSNSKLKVDSRRKEYVPEIPPIPKYSKNRKVWAQRVQEWLGDIASKHKVFEEFMKCYALFNGDLYLPLPAEVLKGIAKSFENKQVGRTIRRSRIVTASSIQQRILRKTQKKS